MPPEDRIAAIAHVIQLAIAPVFLISGVATLLGVLTNRLARIVDRARLVESNLELHDEAHRLKASAELAHLSRRARLVNLALTFSTFCALLTCVTIVTLFMGTFLSVNLSRLITVLFIAAMLSLFLALTTFLGEVITATRGLRISYCTQEGGKPITRPQQPSVED